MRRRRGWTRSSARGPDSVRLSRTISFSNSAMRAELVPASSLLVADGVTRPVLAIRFSDRDGRPVHGGTVGAFTLPAPYLPAVEVDAQTARALSGLERAQPFWRVDGDDGIAYIALEPTTASGALAIDFAFRDGEAHRDARVEAWLDAGQRPWTIVGFAAGTLGFNSSSRHLETLNEGSGKADVDGRIALYAKGRVRGRWLLTLAYDSGKRREDARFVNSVSVDWSPVARAGDAFREAAEVSLFLGTRYASESFGIDDVKGWSNVLGADARLNLTERVDLGVQASARHTLGARAVAWSAGPSVGVTPFVNGWLSVGYNLVGFADRDFDDARYTRGGAYVTMRFKFDQLTLRRLTDDVR